MDEMMLAGPPMRVVPVSMAAIVLDPTSILVPWTVISGGVISDMVWEGGIGDLRCIGICQ